MKGFKAIVLVLGVMTVTAAPAFAVQPDYKSFYDDGSGFSLRIVDSMEKKTGDYLMVFDPNDASRTPYLYITMTGDQWNLFDGFWGPEGSAVNLFTSNELNNTNEAWLQLTDWNTKGNTEGIWSVDGRVMAEDLFKEKRIHFKVAPEPVSAGLFLLGGLGLLGGRAIRRKRA